MILALLLLIQATTPAPVDDIVVIGQRLQRDFKADVRFGKAGAACKIRKSTGDAEIDRIGCTAMTTCFPQYQSRYQGTGDRAIKPETRKVMRAALNGEFTRCVDRQHQALIAELAARRRAEKPQT